MIEHVTHAYCLRLNLTIDCLYTVKPFDPRIFGEEGIKSAVANGKVNPGPHAKFPQHLDQVVLDPCSTPMYFGGLLSQRGTDFGAVLGDSHIPHPCEIGTRRTGI